MLENIFSRRKPMEAQAVAPTPERKAELAELEREISDVERAMILSQAKIAGIENIVRPLRLEIQCSKSAVVTNHLKLRLEDHEPGLEREQQELAQLREKHKDLLVRRDEFAA
jgi:hypothetical protein